MSCNLANDQIMRYFDGTLNDMETAQLMQHLKECGKCSREFTELGEILTTLETASFVEPPQDFEYQVMQKVNSYEKAKKERNAIGTAFLYNIAIVLSVALLAVFATNFNEIDILKSLFGWGEEPNSISSTLFVLFDTFEGIYIFVSGIFTTFLQVNMVIIKTYYHVFLGLFAVMLALQQMIPMRNSQRQEPGQDN